LPAGSLARRILAGFRGNQYPQFLHPAWEKRTSHMHYTGDGRDKLYRLQLERIAFSKALTKTAADSRACGWRTTPFLK
jgi:hypothetical protein